MVFKDVSRRLWLSGTVACWGAAAARAEQPDADAPADTPQAAEAPAGPASLSRVNIQFFGDSLAQGMWLSTHPLLRRREEVRVLNGTRHATGLTRSDEHDWVAVVRDTLARQRAEVVVVWVGANDFRPFVDRQARARFQFHTPEFADAYRRSVNTITGLAVRAGAQLGWLGLPNMRDGQFASAARRLNDAIQQGTEEAGGVFIPTWQATSDETGRFRPSIPGADRLERRFRADDGVHFSDLGYRLMARLAFDRLAETKPTLSEPMRIAKDAIPA